MNRHDFLPLQDDSEGKYEWRIDLRKTEPYWSGWFQGISTIYLSAPVPKLLILAGVDRLDKTLTVAHMQGMFIIFNRINFLNGYIII